MRLGDFLLRPELEKLRLQNARTAGEIAESRGVSVVGFLTSFLPRDVDRRGYGRRWRLARE